LQFISRSLAEWRALTGAALIGLGLGLGLGAIYLTGGLQDRVARQARADAIVRATADGYDESVIVAGAAPRLPIGPVARVRSRTRDLNCLTEAVYYEARSESVSGQRAVAQVVLNRVKHPAFPKSVCAVVFQGAGHRGGCQFSFACDGSMRGRREASAWAEARRVATRALAGAVAREVGSATHYHTIAVNPAWGGEMARVGQVGAHVFYRFSPRKAALARAAAAEHVILTSAPLHAAELRIVPTALETAAEAPAAAPAPEAAPADAAQLKTSQPVAGGS